MPNVLDALGLQVQSRQELIDYLTGEYERIYGADINLESNTPDGQMLNINVQAILDVQDLLVQVFNSMDPDNAVGVVLDQRVSINGIQRQPATYTLTNVTVVNSQSVNLYGLDGAFFVDGIPFRDDGNEVYTTADSAGNRWYLLVTTLGLSAGSHALAFQAAVPGAQLTTPNTITTQITVVLGVDSVNNPTTLTTLGENEESDVALRVRRSKSVSLASQGYYRALRAALENISGITSAFVYENVTDAVDSDGVPGHSIWVIIAGSAADADIAQAIYTKRNAGCGMKGDQIYIVTQDDGTPFTIRWDEVTTRNLFIRFQVTSIDGVIPPAVQLIRDGLAAQFIPGVNEKVNINQIATIVQSIDPNALVTNAGLSTGQSQTLNLSGVAASGAFKIDYNGVQSAAINWNDPIGDIQTKVQGITGLSGATVTGSIGSQQLVVNLSLVGNVQALLFAVDNTLATSDPNPVTFSYDGVYTPTLATPTKQNQLVVAKPNIVITPLSLLPGNSSLEVTETIQFVGAGGYGDLTFSLAVNSSGGSINASSGLYQAGASPGNDTIRVTDKLGQYSEVIIGVTP